MTHDETQQHTMSLQRQMRLIKDLERHGRAKKVVIQATLLLNISIVIIIKLSIC